MFTVCSYCAIKWRNGPFQQLLWEFLIYKREWLVNKELNIQKQKQQSELEKLEQNLMQKPTAQLIDERVDGRVDSKMANPVPVTKPTILVDTLHLKPVRKPV